MEERNHGPRTSRSPGALAPRQQDKQTWRGPEAEMSAPDEYLVAFGRELDDYAKTHPLQPFAAPFSPDAKANFHAVKANLHAPQARVPDANFELEDWEEEEMEYLQGETYDPRPHAEPGTYDADPYADQGPYDDQGPYADEGPYNDTYSDSYVHSDPYGEPATYPRQAAYPKQAPYPNQAPRTSQATYLADRPTRSYNPLKKYLIAFVLTFLVVFVHLLVGDRPPVEKLSKDFIARQKGQVQEMLQHKKGDAPIKEVWKMLKEANLSALEGKVPATDPGTSDPRASSPDHSGTPRGQAAPQTTADELTGTWALQVQLAGIEKLKEKAASLAAITGQDLSFLEHVPDSLSYELDIQVLDGTSYQVRLLTLNGETRTETTQASIMNLAEVSPASGSKKRGKDQTDANNQEGSTGQALVLPFSFLFPGLTLPPDQEKALAFLGLTLPEQIPLAIKKTGGMSLDTLTGLFADPAAVQAANIPIFQGVEPIPLKGLSIDIHYIGYQP